MNKLIAIAGLAAISAADILNLHDMLDTLNSAHEDFLTLQLQKLEEALETIASHSVKLDALEQAQVISHHHYINDETIVLPELGLDDQLCFDPFAVDAGLTLDFSAMLSTWGAPAGGTLTIAKMWLYDKNDEEVAHHFVSNHPETMSFHHSVGLIHTQKVEEAQEFTFCYMVRDKSTGVEIQPNGFEWGYKTLGPQYKLSEHTFDSSDYQLF